jgi:hypothetical protein
MHPRTLYPFVGGGSFHSFVTGAYSFVNQQLPPVLAAPGAPPFIKTHNYPNLQLTQIDL